jgi:pilus assembly protein CpaF
MENMVMMGDIKIPKEAISRQIADSVDLIVQVKRLRDGSRRTTNVTEVIGMEGEVIVTQELFKFEYLDETPTGRSSANIARWAFAPTRSTRPSSSVSTSRTWRLASKPRRSGIPALDLT